MSASRGRKGMQVFCDRIELSPLFRPALHEKVDIGFPSLVVTSSMCKWQ